MDIDRRDVQIQEGSAEIWSWGQRMLTAEDALEIRFGPFELVVSERALRLQGRNCTLGARAFDVLATLVQHRDRVVEKSELLAKAWGDRVVEDNNLTVQISTLRKLLGAQAITTVPGRGYRFTLPCQAAPAAPPASGSGQPGVAVLPFESEGGEAGRYFSEGITEEIITSLAMNRMFFVIARTSTLHYRGHDRRTDDIAAELGVRYLLQGSVRRLGGRLRINAALIDSQLDKVMWADRFEGLEESLFELQADIATRIAGAIDPCVREAEMARAVLRPTLDAGAYDCVLRGLHQQGQEGEQAFQKAGCHFQRAVDLDPRYAQAHAHLAWWHCLCIGEALASESDIHRRLAVVHALRAVEVDPRDAWALATGAHVISFLQHRFAVALDMFEQALSINPNCAVAWARSATTLGYLGRGDEARQRVRRALQISPFDQQAFSFCTTHGIASIACGDWNEAVWWLEKARRLNPRYRAPLRLLIAAQARLGNLEHARSLAAELMAAAPGFRVSEFGSWYPMQSPHREQVLDGLQRAGLPN